VFNQKVQKQHTTGFRESQEPTGTRLRKYAQKQAENKEGLREIQGRRDGVRASMQGCRAPEESTE